MAIINNTKYADSVLTLELNWNSLFVSHSKRHWDAMLRFCVSLCNDKVRAEDLHQTALLKSLKSFQKFVSTYCKNVASNEEVDNLFTSPDVQYHFKNWLYRIVKNTYIDDREVSKRWKLDSSDDSLESLVSPSFEYSEQSIAGSQAKNLKAQEKDFYRHALDDQWKKRFEVLNDRQRSIIFLAAEDYSYKEISAILGLPMGTVMSTLSRALQKLKSNSPDLE